MLHAYASYGPHMHNYGGNSRVIRAITEILEREALLATYLYARFWLSFTLQ
jgi:hypothetical protein